MTYWIIVWLVVCPITGQEVREETKVFSAPSWQSKNMIELPNHLVAIARPEKITEYREEYSPDTDGIGTVSLKTSSKVWEK